MAMINVLQPKCTCPRCEGSGQSIRTMDHLDTRLWDLTGAYARTSIDAGLGAAGVALIGGGTLPETSQIMAQRAAGLQQSRSVWSLRRLALISGVLFAAVLSSDRPAAALLPLSGRIAQGQLLGVLPIAVALTVVVFRTIPQRTAVRIDPDACGDRRRFARYDSLFYCEECHCLYDDDGQWRPANPRGISDLLNIGGQ